MFGRLKKLRQTVLWEYAPDTAVERLYRHCRIAIEVPLVTVKMCFWFVAFLFAVNVLRR